MRIFLLLVTLLYACSSNIDQQTDVTVENIEGLWVIESAKYKGHYLSIDNGEFFGSTYGDQGKVSVAQVIGKQEIFKIAKYRSVNGIYTIESTDVRGRYLIMDGAAVKPTSTQPTGRVGINVYIGQYGQLKAIKQTDSTYAFESVFFPGRYLSMSQDKVQIFNTIGKEEQFFLSKVKE